MDEELGVGHFSFPYSLNDSTTLSMILLGGDPEDSPHFYAQTGAQN